MSDCQYTLNRRDLLVAVNDEWSRFAREAGTDELLPPAILNRSIWEFVADARTRLLQAELLRKARATRKPIRLPFRCDSPDSRRWMELEIRGASGGDVTLTTTLLREERRAALSVLEPRTPAGRPSPLERLNVCGWCNLVQLDDGAWMEVEDLLLAKPGWPLPDSNVELSHRLCAACDQRLATASG